MINTIVFLAENKAIYKYKTYETLSDMLYCIITPQFMLPLNSSTTALLYCFTNPLELRTRVSYVTHTADDAKAKHVSQAQEN